MNFTKYIPFAVLSVFFVLCGCRRECYFLISGYAQGGTYSVTCRTSPSRASELKNGIDSILTVIDRSVSGYNPESLLSLRNSGGDTSEFAGTAELAVYRRLETFCDSMFIATEGILDVDAAALFDVWGFGFKNGEMPDEEEIAEAKADRSRKNFNAVAQGYSADLVAEYLEHNGIEDFLVNVGGEIVCNGVNPKGKGWTIGIDNPVDGNMTPGADMKGSFTTEAGRRTGIVTSGNYRKFYIRDGVKYSHTIDPRTSGPVVHDLLSATILAPSSLLADALATYCMVVGMEESIKMISSRPDLEGCLISQDETWCSDAFILNR